MNVYGMSAKEIYMDYDYHADPEPLIEKGCMVIAQPLMNEAGLVQEEVYEAADQILEFTQRAIDSRHQ